MTTRLDPFLLRPVLVERPWGGSALASLGKQLPEGVAIGESWEVADLPDGVASGVDDPRSRVASGVFEGASLAEVIEARGDALLGPVPATSEGRFPLLVKFLSAREHLSVQVHPHEASVAGSPGARLKAESWYVVTADDDASIYLDFVRGTSLDEVEAVVGTAGVVPLLRRVPTEAGAFHHIPAGLVHALGGGVIVAEVQTPSDTTFRLYDWSAEYGRQPRRLHPEEALASIVLEPEDAIDLPPLASSGERELVSTEHYWVREHRLDQVPLSIVLGRGPKVIVVVAGRAAIGDLEVPLGSTAVVPSAGTANVVTPDGPATILEIGFPV